MKLYGIFDQNQNYKLLRYSTDEQTSRTYQQFDYSTKTYYEVKEICLPNIEYSEDNIGKSYNQSTNTFE
jgi:hypothetical protein